MDSIVHAAGGVVWRRDAAGQVEVVLVHRAKRCDWSFPKGKRDPGESDEQCALREVEEETGLRCRLGLELAGASYVDRNGRPKLVRYWEMTVDGDGRFDGVGEIDDIRWLVPEAASALLSYGNDRLLLAELLERLAGPGGSSQP